MAQRDSSEAKPDAKRCFMITPIGGRGSATRKHADWVYKYVGDACRDRNITLERADTMIGSPMITGRIFDAVKTADFCVADLTGLNANVFYELGVRHSLAKPVIHIAAEGTELPFDNAQHDTSFFDLTSIESMEGLTKSVGAQLDEIGRPEYVVSNPFTAALGTIKLSQSGDSRDQVIGRLEERVAALERPTVRPTSRSDAMAVLFDLLARNKSAPKNTLMIEPDFMEKVVAEIPPWETDIAQNLVWRLQEAKGLENRHELVNLIIARFPEAIPF